MGREAVTYAEIGFEKGEVKLLLESTELIVRGDIKRRIARSSLHNVTVVGESLMLKADGEPMALHLGHALASAWQKAILTPPPSLASKLGLKDFDRALLMGPLDDAVLAQSLVDHHTDSLANAKMVIAVVFSEADVQAAILLINENPTLALWLVYLKGKAASFGDGDIRKLMRSAGFIDSKSSAVSERLTATRYGLTKN